jgi:hypothetical protein
MTNNFDSNKLFLKFGDMLPGLDKKQLEIFLRVIEQTYTGNKDNLSSNSCLYISYYEKERYIVLSHNMRRLLFNETFDKLIKIEKRYKLRDCHYLQTKKEYNSKKYVSDDVFEEEDEDNIFTYDHLYYRCNKNKLMKKYKKREIESEFDISMGKGNEEEEEEEEENEEMVMTEDDRNFVITGEGSSCNTNTTTTIMDKEYQPVECIEDDDEEDDEDVGKEEEIKQNMVWKKAAILALDEHGGPMKICDIQKIITDKGYRNTNDNGTAQASCSSAITSSLTAGELIFHRPKRGWYGLFKWLSDGEQIIYIKKQKKKQDENMEVENVEKQDDNMEVENVEKVQQQQQPPDLIDRNEGGGKNDEDEMEEEEDGENTSDMVYDEESELKKKIKKYKKYDRYVLIKKPDQQFKILIREFSINAFFESNMIFKEKNRFNKEIREKLIKVSDERGINYINPKQNNYKTNYYSENVINFSKYLKNIQSDDDNQYEGGGGGDDDDDDFDFLERRRGGGGGGDGNNNNNNNNNQRRRAQEPKFKFLSKKRNFSELEEEFVYLYDERQLKRKKTKEVTNKQKVYELSLSTYPIYKLPAHIQYIIRSGIAFVKHVSNNYKIKYKDNESKMLDEKNKLFKDLMTSKIAKKILPDTVNYLFDTWDTIHEDKMNINYKYYLRKKIGIKYRDPIEEEEEGEKSDDSDEDTDTQYNIPYKPIISILNLFKYSNVQLNLKNNFISFFLCIFSLWSGFNYDENSMNLLILALPGTGKTYILLLFFKIFFEFTELYTIRETNKVSTVRFNTSDLKIRAYTDMPEEFLKSVKNLKNAYARTAKNIMLNEADVKFQCNKYLVMAEFERENRTIARLNSRPIIGCSVTNIDRDDGGDRRFHTCILRQGNFETKYLHFMKSIENFDGSQKNDFDKYRKHLMFLTRGVLMYFLIHYTQVNDKRKMPYVTDFYTLIVIYRVVENYKRLYHRDITTDTIKRIRVVSRMFCILRNIEEMFCFPGGKYYKRKKSVPPLQFYNELQKKCYTNMQDLVFALNCLNDGLYNRTLNNFMNNIMKEYELDKLAEPNENEIFKKKENLVKFFNEKRNEDVTFERKRNQQRREVSINPNFIVINTKKNKWKYLQSVSERIKIPKSQLIRVLEDLNTNINIPMYKNVKVEYQDITNNNNQTIRNNIIREQIELSDLQLYPQTKIQKKFSEETYSNNYRMTFNIHAVSYEGNDISKLVLLDEEKGGYEILKPNELIREKKRDLRKFISDEKLKLEEGSLNELEMDEAMKELVKKGRKKFSLHKYLTIKNYLRDDQNIFRDTQSLFTENDYLKNIFNKKKFYIKEPIRELNRKMHKELLRMCK